MFYYPESESECLYCLVGACAQNESQPMHGMFVFDLIAPWGWAVVGACDRLWDNKKPIGYGMVGQVASDDVAAGLFGFAVVAGRDSYGVGACDQSWPNYGYSLTLASCGGDIRYMVGTVGLSCLCLQFREMLAEYTLGA